MDNEQLCPSCKGAGIYGRTSDDVWEPCLDTFHDEEGDD